VRVTWGPHVKRAGAEPSTMETARMQHNCVRDGGVQAAQQHRLASSGAERGKGSGGRLVGPTPKTTVACTARGWAAWEGPGVRVAEGSMHLPPAIKHTHCNKPTAKWKKSTSKKGALPNMAPPSKTAAKHPPRHKELVKAARQAGTTATTRAKQRNERQAGRGEGRAQDRATTPTKAQGACRPQQRSTTEAEASAHPGTGAGKSGQTGRREGKNKRGHKAVGGAHEGGGGATRTRRAGTRAGHKPCTRGSQIKAWGRRGGRHEARGRGSPGGQGDRGQAETPAIRG